ncbi:MAG TPA: anhydro-N-acetylmuramic acid kinase [Halothiobacillaceae bacterium]|nr:anhydro-N-acetylmuramic acid kinase [Halothiobacillaceae bacterium]
MSRRGWPNGVTNNPQADYFIGVMSGTSLDGVDACLVDFTHRQPRVVDMASCAMPEELRTKLRLLATPNSQPGFDAIDLLGECEQAHAQLCVNAILQLLKNTQVNPEQIKACGVHGQTIRHRPEAKPEPFTLQIGNPALIAEKTGISVVSDFRRRDMAAGGQGAPLVPPAHRALFPLPTAQRQLVLNLGGIANLSVLAADQAPLGFDTGPANVLLDQWAEQHLNQPYDDQGRWAQSGTVNPALLEALLADPYFQKPPPKSTGTEYFNQDWLLKRLRHQPTIAPVDVQATLLALTVQSIVAASTPWLDQHTARVIICGGGVKNRFLIEQISLRLKTEAPNLSVVISDDLGIAAQSVECASFAWLAKQWLAGLPGNAPEVTGAKGMRILGGYYPA